MIRKIKGLIARYILTHSKTLPKNSRKLYKLIKKANFK